MIAPPPAASEPVASEPSSAIAPAVLVPRLAGATAAAEAAGLLLSGTVSALVASRVAEGATMWLTIAGGLVVGMLEGALVGWAQAWALRFDRRARVGYMRATAAGFGLGWMLGLAASALGVDVVFGETVASDWGALLGAPIVGAAFGAIVAPLQAGWVEPVCSRRRWIGGSTLAWGLGFLPPQGLTLLVQYGPGLPDAALLTALSGALTGVVVGVVLAGAILSGRPRRSGADFAL